MVLKKILHIICSRMGNCSDTGQSFRHLGLNTTFQKISLLKGPQYISIGDKCSFEQFLFLTAWDFFQLKNSEQHFSPSIIIGANCYFGAFNHITAINRIEIGDNLLTGKFVDPYGPKDL